MLYEFLKEHIQALNKASHAYASAPVCTCFNPILTAAYKQYFQSIGTQKGIIRNSITWPNDTSTSQQLCFWTYSLLLTLNVSSNVNSFTKPGVKHSFLKLKIKLLTEYNTILVQSNAFVKKWVYKFLFMWCNLSVKCRHFFMHIL